jgi:crotonobetainyl-CoA:carnitine CoA-transferase CaiB-like acyl-CoA transferase
MEQYAQGSTNSHAKMTSVQSKEFTSGGPTNYNLIDETHELVKTRILKNPLISKSLPVNASAYASKIHFIGHTEPAIPIPWRFAESVVALKALEAIMIGGLLKQRYGIEAQKVEINVDHAQLFIMSAMLTSVVIDGNPVQAMKADQTMKPDPGLMKIFPTYDIYRALASPYRLCVTNIYRTKDNRYFSLHGSMNPGIILQAIGMPEEGDGDFEESALLYQDKLSQYSAEEIEYITAVKTKQAGTICWSVDEFKASEHGQANAHVGLWETHRHSNPNQQASWWPSSPQTSPARPLAGLKVVDLTRVIAGPAITRGLAELGASVMRITAPHLQDLGTLHPDLSWGKWNCSLDFRDPVDLAAAKALIQDADVVVSGYRPAVLDKYGLGQAGILELTENRPRGVIFARENCYGWYGPWSGRSGWQQISDACCGISFDFGRAMGNNEPVTPVFPNTDYCTGIVGVCGILDALMQRASKGGSYTVDLALNYYSQWLVNSVGKYPDDVWQKVWKRNGQQVMRYYYPMGRTSPLYFDMLARSAPYLFHEDFFEIRDVRAVGAQIRTVKPILRWTDGLVQPGFQVGTRRNGIDTHKWPDDLLTELVK